MRVLPVYAASMSNTPIAWRFLGVINEAGARLCEAERELAGAEARLLEVGAVIARIRHAAERLGVPLSQPAMAVRDSEHGVSIDEFARQMGWGAKRMRSLVRAHMTHGVHYHRNGRRYVVHPSAAAEFVMSFSASIGVTPEARSVVDEVTRFRAREALRKVAK